MAGIVVAGLFVYVWIMAAGELVAAVLGSRKG